MIENIKKLFRVEDFKFRLYNTFLFILIFRIGAFVVLPGVDSSKLKPYKDGVLGMLDTFLGGAFSNASIFGLGVIPYISASIAVQLLTIIFPKFQRIQMEGFSGRKRLNKLTKLLTLLIASFQAIPYIYSLINKGIVFVNPMYFAVYSVIFLVSGTLFCVWLGDRITDKGIGNGSSLLITVGIVSSIPNAVFSEYLSLGKSSGLLLLAIEFVVLYFILMFVIAFTQATRKVPIIFANQFDQTSNFASAKQNISFKLNNTGIMPVIFAQTLMFIPSFIVASLASKSNLAASISKWFMDVTSWQYSLVFGTLIILFTFFYTAITINPDTLATDMKRQNSFIPGVASGKQTSVYLDGIISRLTLPSAVILAVVAILPTFAKMAGISPSFSRFFGGTSVIILVGVMLDIIQQVQSFSILSQYESIGSKSNIKKLKY